MPNPTFLAPSQSISSHLMTPLEDLGLACASKIYQGRSFKERAIASLGLGLTISTMLVNYRLARYENIAWLALGLLSIPFKPVAPQLANHFFEKLESSLFTQIRCPFFLFQVVTTFFGVKREMLPTATKESELRLCVDMFLSQFVSIVSFGKLPYEIATPEELYVLNIFLRKSDMVDHGSEHSADASSNPKNLIRKHLFDLTPTGAGVIFLKNDILSDLTDGGETQKMCTDRIDTSERGIEIFTFVMYKTIFIYTYGKRSEEPLPSFLDESLRGYIQELRDRKANGFNKLGKEMLNSVVNTLTPSVTSALAWHHFYDECEDVRVKLNALIEEVEEAQKQGSSSDSSGITSLQRDLAYTTMIRTIFNVLRKVANRHLAGDNRLLKQCWPLAFPQTS